MADEHRLVMDEDEQVARLLAEDARKSSLKYSALGLDALLPQRLVNRIDQDGDGD